MRTPFHEENLSAMDAISEAQRIAFAPMLFQTALSLRDTGILQYLDDHPEGVSLDTLTEQCSITPYVAGLLLDMGVSGQLVLCHDRHYFPSKIGHYLLHDTMTRVNINFTRDVCYQGLHYLPRALQEGIPAGLQVFGDWPTIYPALSQLPEPARTSWFEFDHFYSDAAFDSALPHVFALQPRHIYDVGGNTGKWALRCCRYCEDVSVTILDLPEQVALARPAISQDFPDARIDFHAVDMLSATVLPGEADVWWMSQFLDCFSPEQILHILRKIIAAMKPEARICIMELFTDTQKFAAAEFSINATSLYFTCMANGNSRFYRSDIFRDLVCLAGLKIEHQIDNLGIGHSLLICSKP